MDSANSGSLHSSSGGDEEYDSRAADSVSVFNPPPFFDPLSDFLQLHQNPNSSSFLNPTVAWPRTYTTLRSDPNPNPNPNLNPIAHDNTTMLLPNSPPPFMRSFQHPSADNLSHQNQAAAAAPARNPKKRSRASRRAPTTVLTTDTTNFRAMVQEFTGIPAPPFSNISSFSKSRFDLFGGTRTTTTTSTTLEPPYLRRPFAQKVQPPLPFFSSSSATAVDAIAAASSSTTTNSTSNLFNNPFLSSFLESNPKFQFPSSIPLMGSKQSFEIQSDFGLGHGNDHISATLSSLPNLIPSDNHNGNREGMWSNGPDGDKDDHHRRINNFGGGKAPENVVSAAARGDGTVESWICSNSE